MTDVQQIDASRVDAHPNGNGKVMVAGVKPAAATKPPVPRVDKRDPRYLALRNFAVSVTVFNILGYTILGFEQPWAFSVYALALGYSVEIIVELMSAWAENRRPGFTGNGMWGVYTFLLPTHITSLVVNMLLYANDRFWPVAFGVVIGVGQKAVLRAPIKGRMRHFMNPSNFGITAVLLAFWWVSIAPPYQFTENVPDIFRLFIPFVVATAGTVLNASLTRKVPLIMGWVGSFVIQALLRWWIWDVALYSALAVTTGVAFILFTNYMVTDPGTTPSSGMNQFMFGSGVGFVYGILMAFNIVYTLFFAVSIVCLVRGLYWWGRHFWSKYKARAAAAAAEPAPVLAAVGS